MTDKPSGSSRLLGAKLKSILSSLLFQLVLAKILLMSTFPKQNPSVFHPTDVMPIKESLESIHILSSSLASVSLRIRDDNCCFNSSGANEDF